jgi:hypothetical protein
VISYLLTFAAGFVVGGAFVGVGVWATLSARQAHSEMTRERRSSERRAVELERAALLHEAIAQELRRTVQASRADP